MQLIPMRGFDRGFAPLQRQVNRLFDDFFANDGLHGGWGRGDFFPAIDVAENETEVIVVAEVPGVDSAGLEVTVTGNTLTLSGEKESVGEEKGRNWHRVERAGGRFTRVVTLPEGVDAGDVTAKAEDGLLRIRLGKKENAVPKKIEVQVG